MQFHVSDIGVAPSDGDIAYACTTTLSQSSQTEAVVTHDGGMSWGPVTNINVNFDGCSYVTVDATYAILDSDSGNGASFSLAVS